MVANSIKSLAQIASFFNVKLGKTTINENGLPSCTVDKQSLCGYFNIIEQLIKASNSKLGGTNELERAQIHQWIEYGIVYGGQTDTNVKISQILKELNSILSTKTYLVSEKLTVADVFLYYVLRKTMENLSILEKEVYINVSRWFDNLQQDALIRQSNTFVNFSTIYLASVVPARH